jgi:hypothetical protein
MGFPSEMCDVRGASGIILGNPNSQLFSFWEFPKPHGKSQLTNIFIVGNPNSPISSLWEIPAHKYL